MGLLQRSRRHLLKAKDGRKHLIAVLLLSVLLATFLRSIAIVKKDTLWHDEAISYLIAACQITDFGHPELRGTLSDAAEWKNNLRINDTFCFNTIRSDLINTDIHPPLYFWLLHLWSLAFGIHLWTGPSLNVIFAILTLLTLFLLARDVLDNPAEVAIVVIIYALASSYIADISTEARQYDLLAFLAVLLIWQLVRLTNSSGPIQPYKLILLALTTTAGALTHFHYVIVILAGALLLTIKLVNIDRSRLMKILAAMLAGYVIAMVIFPTVSVVLNNQNRFGDQSSPAEVLIRTLNLAKALAPFSFIVLSGIGVYLFRNSLRVPDRKQMIPSGRKPSNIQASHIIQTGLVVGGVIIFLYMTGITPLHAMAPKYLILSWPFLAFFPALIIRSSQYRPTVLLFLYLTSFALGTAYVINQIRQKSYDSESFLNRPGVIIIDTYVLGILPQILWHIDDDRTVIINNQNQLLKRFDEWVDELENTNLYISELSYATSESGRSELIRRMEKTGYDVSIIGYVPIKSGRSGTEALVFLLEKS